MVEISVGNYVIDLIRLSATWGVVLALGALLLFSKLRDCKRLIDVAGILMDDFYSNLVPLGILAFGTFSTWQLYGSSVYEIQVYETKVVLITGLHSATTTLARDAIRSTVIDSKASEDDLWWFVGFDVSGDEMWWSPPLTSQQDALQIAEQVEAELGVTRRDY